MLFFFFVFFGGKRSSRSNKKIERNTGAHADNGQRYSNYSQAFRSFCLLPSVSVSLSDSQQCKLFFNFHQNFLLTAYDLCWSSVEAMTVAAATAHRVCFTNANNPYQTNIYCNCLSIHVSVQV